MPGNERTNLYRLAGMGLEYFGAAVVLGVIGYWIDRKFDTWPWAAMTGFFAGCIGAMYLLVKEAMTANKRLAEKYKREHAHRDDDAADDT